MENKHIKHLYWRAGFGVNPKQLERLSQLEKKEVVDELFYASKETKPLIIDLGPFKNLSREEFARDNKNERKLRKVSRNLVQELNNQWINRLVNPQEVLREKMTLFWANHFVCSDNMITYILNFNNTLREHALGNFSSFTKAISRETAMIRYLDLKQNRKLKPNENFARELMELFTLGVGNYSEEDIKESAKAFTGYNHNFEGDFVFKKNQHDDGFKYFFGKSGRYNGDDIIDIILEKKECATFICRKIYTYFVNDKINNDHIYQMVNQFYPNYDIEDLMRFVFMSDWFYNEENIGVKIKSPIELLVGIKQVVPLTFKKTKDVIRLQKNLGQVLLDPPNVAGWKGGKNWIDSNTILLRLKLPSLLLNSGLISTKEDGGFNDTFKKFHEEYSKKGSLRTNARWDVFYEVYRNVSFEELKNLLIVAQISEGTDHYLERLSKSSIKDNCIQLMSLPEYQMC